MFFEIQWTKISANRPCVAAISLREELPHRIYYTIVLTLCNYNGTRECELAGSMSKTGQLVPGCEGRRMEKVVTLMSSLFDLNSLSTTVFTAVLFRYGLLTSMVIGNAVPNQNRAASHNVVLGYQTCTCNCPYVIDGVLVSDHILGTSSTIEFYLVIGNGIATDDCRKRDYS